MASNGRMEKLLWIVLTRKEGEREKDGRKKRRKEGRVKEKGRKNLNMIKTPDPTSDLYKIQRTKKHAKFHEKYTIGKTQIYGK